MCLPAFHFVLHCALYMYTLYSAEHDVLCLPVL
jgi:hypothetical protein